MPAARAISLGGNIYRSLRFLHESGEIFFPKRLIDLFIIYSQRQDNRNWFLSQDIVPALAGTLATGGITREGTGQSQDAL